jgi:5-methylcytosine-specific restriction endonuclease McrA
MEIGGRQLGHADCERIACDAAESTPGERNQTTIPPRVRRAVLARDRHRCRAPGCGRTRFLEVHHLKPRSRGGTNDPANLITLCAACHRLWHERGGVARRMRSEALGPTR